MLLVISMITALVPIYILAENGDGSDSETSTQVQLDLYIAVNENIKLDSKEVNIEDVKVISTTDSTKTEGTITVENVTGAVTTIDKDDQGNPRPKETLAPADSTATPAPAVIGQTDEGTENEDDHDSTKTDYPINDKPNQEFNNDTWDKGLQDIGGKEKYDELTANGAEKIWESSDVKNPTSGDVIKVTHTIDVKDKPLYLEENLKLTIAADNAWIAFVNGVYVGQSGTLKNEYDGKTEDVGKLKEVFGDLSQKYVDWDNWQQIGSKDITIKDSALLDKIKNDGFIKLVIYAANEKYDTTDLVCKITDTTHQHVKECYHKHNGDISCNPAFVMYDLSGIKKAVPTPTPSSSSTATPTPTPSASSSATPTPTPSASTSTTPSESPEPTPSESPEVTPSDEPAESPSASPSASPTPSRRPTPAPSSTPDITVPSITEEPEESSTPEESTTPEESSEPEESTSPEPSQEPATEENTQQQQNVQTQRTVEQNGRSFTITQNENGDFVVLDENGVPLGYLDLPEGTSLEDFDFEDFDILDGLIPLGGLEPEVPYTGDNNRMLLFSLLGLASITGAVVLKRKMSSTK